jgi:hypothetical protein
MKSHIPYPCGNFYEDVIFDGEMNCTAFCNDGSSNVCGEPLDDHPYNPARFNAWLQQHFGGAQFRRMKMALGNSTFENEAEMYKSLVKGTEEGTLARIRIKFPGMVDDDINALAGVFHPPGNTISFFISLR